MDQLSLVRSAYNQLKKLPTKAERDGALAMLGGLLETAPFPGPSKPDPRQKSLFDDEKQEKAEAGSE